MASNWRVRPQRCTGCGEKVVIVESRASALGGLLRTGSTIRVQHADFEPHGKAVDHVDGDCRRPRVSAPEQ